MKKTIWLSLVVSLALVPAVASAAITAYDTSLLFRQLQIINNHVNNIRDSDSINSVVSPKNQGLIKTIDSHVVGKNVQFTQIITKIEETSTDQVRITGTYTAQGQDGHRSWKNKGSDFYVFSKDKQTAKWFLVDTDFYQNIGVDSQAAHQAAIVTWVALILLVLAALFAWRFREQLRPLIRRLRKLRLPAISLPRRQQRPGATRVVRRPIALPEDFDEPPAPVMHHEPPAESAAPAMEHRPITPPEPSHTIDLRQHKREDEE